MAALIEGTMTGPMAIRRAFEASPEVVQQGRLLVESQSRAWKIAQATIDSAVLVASEILTNAVRAARGRQISLRLALTDGGLRIEVWDPSPLKPRPSTPDLTMPLEPVPDDAPDPGGWGLDIIATLSSAHGCRAEHEGKTVWAVLPL